MNKQASFHPKKQCWLKIYSDLLTIFETGSHSDGLPYLKIIASLPADSPLNNPSTHIDWVKQNITTSQLNILIAEDLYQLLLSDVPDVPDSELDAAIELKAADLISYDLDDAILDVIRLPSEAYRGRMKMAFIVAMQKLPVQQWLVELIQKGVKVGVVDVSATQLRNFGLRTRNFPESGIFHLQPKKCRLVLNYQDEMVLSRTFETGLQDIVGAEQTVQEDELEITVDTDSQTTIQLESLALDVRRSFDYYESQLGLGAVAELNILCGADYVDVAKTLAGKLGVRFNIINPADYLHIFADEETVGSGNFYGLIGSVYREAY